MKYMQTHFCGKDKLDMRFSVSSTILGGMLLTNVMRHTPVKASHILMVLSRDPEMRNGPGAGPPFFFCRV